MGEFSFSSCELGISPEIKLGNKSELHLAFRMAAERKHKKYC